MQDLSNAIRTYVENDGSNHRGWKMQDYIDLDLICAL